MIHRLAVIVVAAVLACCSPAPAPSGSGPVQTAHNTTAPPQTPQACAAAGGTMRPVCRRQIETCVIVHADAGKPCTDSDQCQGDCRAEPSDRPPAINDTGVKGFCQANSDPCGCYTNIEDGRPARTICVD